MFMKNVWYGPLHRCTDSILSIGYWSWRLDIPTKVDVEGKANRCATSYLSLACEKKKKEKKEEILEP